mmetsp:Transcript_54370/g.129560  ORF Transcript_54370/g.129560 Transcript_54370/m.129560 type:complete len:398 (-) Transcript_54370:92-1285(-)
MPAGKLKLFSSDEDEEEASTMLVDSDSDEEAPGTGGKNRICCGLCVGDEEPLIWEMTKVMVGHPILILSGLALLVFSVIFLMLEEGWEFVTTIYLIMQIVTTIGWGDLTVDKEWAQIVMSFVVLLSLIILAKILSLFLDVLITRQEKRGRQALRFVESGFHHEEEQDWRKDYVLRKRWEKINRFLFSLFLFVSFIIVGTLFYSLTEYCTCSYGVTEVPGCSRGEDRRDMDLCLATGGYKMTWINAFYFSVISLTTVGFGDYSPKSYGGRLFAIPWAILGVLSTGFFIAATSDLLSPEQEEAITDLQDIDEDLFKKIDADSNGYLTKAEFRIWSLVARGVVDEDLITAIDAKYDRMDTLSPGDQQVRWEDIVRAREVDKARYEAKVEERDRMWPSWLC